MHPHQQYLDKDNQQDKSFVEEANSLTDKDFDKLKSGNNVNADALKKALKEKTAAISNDQTVRK